jgi:dephospho-CoA kinase
MIVGVTGFFAAGKDTVADYLVEDRRFRHISLSDLIRQTLRDEGREVNIPNLTETGTRIRRERGPGALAEMALEAMADGSDCVVTSIRHPAEVEALRRRGDFSMLFVDAPIALRYERSVSRAREGDAQSFEAFESAESAQMSSDDSNAQRLSACRDMADHVIDNDSTVEALRRAVDEAIGARP